MSPRHRAYPSVAAAALMLRTVTAFAPISASAYVVAPGPPAAEVPRHLCSERWTTATALSAAEEAAEYEDRRSFLVSTTAASAAALAFPPSIALLGRPGAAEAAAATAASSSASSKSKIPDWTLDGGVKFPVLALNTVGLSVDDTERAVGYALREGITHIDFHPGKERDGVARYLEANPGSRSKLFLNTKIRKPQPGKSPEDAAKRARDQIKADLTVLGVKKVDMLMLRDSPDCDTMRAQWKVMEEALRGGKTRSIGVINYCEKSLRCLLKTAEVKPALNYYMTHVGMGPNPRALRSYCDSVGIRTFAYGAIGEPGPNDAILNSPILKRIGRKHGGKSPEEVALRWVLQGGRAASVRPTAEFGLGFGVCTEGNGCREGLKRRARVFDWELSGREMEELDKLRSPSDNPTLFSSTGCPDSFVMPKK